MNNKLGVKHRKDIDDLKELVKTDGYSSIKLRFSEEILATIKIQFIVLGYIEEKIEMRTKKGVRIIKLTDLGQKELIRRRAIRKIS